ncbi:MAG: response regulator transcription factor [Terrimesophilobacter sp.]
MAQRRVARSPGIRVAIVDDLQLVIDGLSAHLTVGNYGITVVIRARSWADLVSHPEFPPDVTVLDLNLRDGLHLATKIQALRTAGSEVVVMSRHADAASVARAIQAGALGFVPKTDSGADLVEAIRSAAVGKQSLNGTLTAAISGIIASKSPGLGEREQQAISLYSTGRSVRQVATEMMTTEETIKSYIKRARRKYREAGIELGTRVLLRQHGVREGWVDPD